MATQATHDLAIKIGTVFRHEDGGTSIKLDCLPVGMQEWNGWVSVFKRENQAAGNGQSAQGRVNGHGGNGKHPPQGFDDFDDDIPF
jgi:hypothetical protein